MTEEDQDYELNSFVAAWAAPAPDFQFHARVRAAFDREFIKTVWWRRYRLAEATTAILLLTMGLAVAQTGHFTLPLLGPSMTIDSEEILYAGKGARATVEYTRTVPMEGHDMVLWKYFPDRPYDNILEGIETQAGYFLYRLTLPFFKGSEPAASEVNAGCLHGGEKMVGEEQLLGYSTIVFEWNGDSAPFGSWSRQGSVPKVHLKATVWRAPALGCRVLRSTFAGQRPDGSYQVLHERRVLGVVP